MRTFSMLPWQLAPYHRYTIESMAVAVILWQQVWVEDGGGASATIEEIHGDSGVTPWLLRHWLGVLVAGLRSSHRVLRRWYDLDDIKSAQNRDRAGLLDEVYAYFTTISSRDPPQRKALCEVFRKYGAATGRHMVGRPSLERLSLSGQ
jgi:hypothetical protein